MEPELLDQYGKYKDQNGRLLVILERRFDFTAEGRELQVLRYLILDVQKEKAKMFPALAVHDLVKQNKLIRVK